MKNEFKRGMHFMCWHPVLDGESSKRMLDAINRAMVNHNAFFVEIDPHCGVGVQTWFTADGMAVSFLNYNYHRKTGAIEPINSLSVKLHGVGDVADVSIIPFEGESVKLDDECTITIQNLHVHCIVLIKNFTRRTL